MTLKMIHHQFLVDVPRLTIYIDDTIYDNSSFDKVKQLWTFISKHFNADIGKIALYFTQICLADIYKTKLALLQDEQKDEHLLSCGHHVVRLCTTTKNIVVEKEFRRVAISPHLSEFEIEILELILHYNNVNDKESHMWSSSLRVGSPPITFVTF